MGDRSTRPAGGSVLRLLLPALAGAALLQSVAACGDSTAGSANTAPVAVVSPVIGAVRGDTVVLDGTSSHDADGDSLTFTWSLVSAPAGSGAAISPVDGVSPAFVADRVGDYVVSLVVHDGHESSAPQGTAITVLVPAPAVTISTPTDLAVVTASPVTVTGEVDDPAATVTVNGVPGIVDPISGAYSASVPLQPGNNVITTEAVNPTGVGTAAIAVILNTADAPVVIVTSPADNFLVGKAYLVGVVPTPEMVPVRGVIRVFTTEAGNVPSVTVSGVAATVGDTSFSGCPAGLPKRCYKYSVTMALGRGRHTLQVIGTDVLSGADTASVTGASDVAYRPTGTEWSQENEKVTPVAWSGPTPRDSALTQTRTVNPRQNNRAHEVDGCSVPVPELDGTWRNDPMHAATQNVASTEFGAGSRPPTEFFIHGKKPARALPCNTHDVCYQTIGANRATCDTRFYDDMRAVCRKAYPTIEQPNLHPIYTAEQNQCYKWAQRYYDAVHTRGQPKFDKRQAQFAWQ